MHKMRAVCLGILLVSGAGFAPAARADVLVFAAASLKNALDDATAAFAGQNGIAVKNVYAASSALARQIAEGAPADLFISADRKWMDYLAHKHLIMPRTRVDLFGNRLVLIAPKSSNVSVTLKPGVSLLPYLDGGRLAVADPAAVPAGLYARAALEHLGAWTGVEHRLAPAEDVRAALRFVALGEAPLGIVYATDAAAEPGVRIVAAFPPESHPPIVYPAAIVIGSHNPGAEKLLAFLRSPAARPYFLKQGFTVLGR